MDGTTISFDRTQKDGSLMNYYQNSDMKQPFSMGNISLSYELDSLSNISARFNHLRSEAERSSDYPDVWRHLWQGL